MKLLYIYAGPRNPYAGSRNGLSSDDTEREMPDTWFYGYNHLPSFGMSADFIARDDALPSWLQNSFLGKFIGFRMRQALLFFKARSYDIVFGTTLVYLMPFKKLFGGKARYVVLNTELVRMLRGSLKHPLRYRIIVSLFKEFSAIVCLATSQKEWLLAQCPFLKDKVFFVPLSADANFFQPVYEGRGDTVLSVGGNDGRDYRTFLDAAEQMPETHFEIVCHPRNLAGISHIPSNVSVQYDLPPTEVRKKYQTACMIAIITHDDSSTLGADCSGQTVLLDAMSSGLPIIASRKASLVDYVREGQEALIVDPYNPDQLVNAIKRLQRDDALRSSIAKSARIRVEHEFSNQAMAEKLSHIFKKTLAIRV